MPTVKSCGYLHFHSFGGWSFTDDYRSGTSLGFHFHMVFFFLCQSFLSRESNRSSVIKELTKIYLKLIYLLQIYKMFFRNVKVCQTTKTYKKFSDIISTLNV